MAYLDMFKAEKIFPRTWQITYEFAEFGPKINPVYCYLLEGDTYALVIDTMYGYGNLRAFCETLTDKPMKVVNTHFHGDHIAGNYHFDVAYIHWRDLPYYYGKNFSLPGGGGFPKTQQEIYERAKFVAKPEYADKLQLEDFKAATPIELYTIEDGDIFDLGDRQIEVIWVGGHSPGCIALLDRKNRCVYTGDCCNGNTILGIGNSLPIEEYLENLLHFYEFRSEFDITYGGHQVIPACVVEEGIELCARILAGTDDKEERQTRHGVSTYGAAREPGGYRRADGKHFNISYVPGKLLKEEKKPQIIKN
ncbi:MAG: MBL fold metallo-hydrolase [Solobacterium sp.]|nr:MBL fold metallo-hydrolase [Solobacterium sp.]